MAKNIYVVGLEYVIETFVNKALTSALCDGKFRETQFWTVAGLWSVLRDRDVDDGRSGDDYGHRSVCEPVQARA